MLTEEHYFIERNAEGKFTVKAAGAESPCAVFDTQRDTVAYARELNPLDRPDVARIRYAEQVRPMAALESLRYRRGALYGRCL